MNFRIWRSAAIILHAPASHHALHWHWRLIVVTGMLACIANVEATAGVIVLVNRTSQNVSFDVVAANEATTSHVITAGHLLSIRVPAQEETKAHVQTSGSVAAFKIRPYAAYFFTAVANRIELHELGLARPDEVQPLPTESVATIRLATPQPLAKWTVKLLVDDEEPGTQAVWEPRLRKRVAWAAEVLRQQIGLELEVVAVDTWRSDNGLQDFDALRREFEVDVDPTPARLAIGFTRQPSDTTKNHDLNTVGALGRHLLVVEPARESPEERVARLLHALGHHFGALHSPELQSVMSASPERQLHPDRIRFDSINALVMATISEELADRDVEKLADLSHDTRSRLWDWYAVLHHALEDDRLNSQAYRLLSPKEISDSQHPAAVESIAQVGTASKSLQDSRVEGGTNSFESRNDPPLATTIEIQPNRPTRPRRDAPDCFSNSSHGTIAFVTAVLAWITGLILTAFFRCTLRRGTI